MNRVAGQTIALWSVAVANQLQVLNHFGHTLTANQLHRVVMNAPFFADRVDRDDMGVIEHCRSADFVAKTQQLFLLQRAGHRQDLERNVAAHGNLFGFVDNPHAARSQLVQQPKIAELFAIREIDPFSTFALCQ